jgi:hypothetical protein
LFGKKLAKSMLINPLSATLFINESDMV